MAGTKIIKKPPRSFGFRKPETYANNEELIETKREAEEIPIGNNDPDNKDKIKFKVMLVADPDFDLYKQVSWE